VAKVTRDRAIKFWRFKEMVAGGEFVSGAGIGSGYPGDRLTIDWVQKYISCTGGLPEIVRFSWKTTKNQLSGKGVCMDAYSMYRYMTQKEFYETGCPSGSLNSGDYIKGMV
jgi:hypothetical protein